MTSLVRDLAPQDEAAWRTLWSDYLAFYDVSLPASVTARTWARLNDPLSPLGGRVAVVDGRVLGFALHHHHLSTWAEGADGYLEDLFVSSDARGLGLGRMLLDDLVSLARARGWSRLYWMTDEGNTRARTLYDSYTPSDGHVRYRLQFEADQ